MANQKQMMIACNNCNNLYDYNSQSTSCPHREFPKPCKLHNRLHCGEIECTPKIVYMEEIRKTG